MSETDQRKVKVGAVLLVISTILIFGPGTLSIPLPAVALAVGVLGLAAGSLLVGTSESERPV